MVTLWVLHGMREYVCIYAGVWTIFLGDCQNNTVGDIDGG